MIQEFKGRCIIPGNITGKALVSHEGLNPLASWKKPLLKRKPPAICSDQNNRDLYHKQLDGKIICLPQFIGSTSGGLALQTAIDLKLGPKALLFSNHIDSLAASGVILSDIWSNQQVITIDQLGDAFLTYVRDDMDITIKTDGTVFVSD